MTPEDDKVISLLRRDPGAPNAPQDEWQNIEKQITRPHRFWDQFFNNISIRYAVGTCALFLLVIGVSFFHADQPQKNVNLKLAEYLIEESFFGWEEIDEMDFLADH